MTEKLNAHNWKEKELFHLSELWDVRPAGVKEHTKELWNEKARDWEKELREDERRALRSKRRVEATASYLIERGILTKDADVIDIGCGPGRFVAEFAKTARHSDGLDISDLMTDYGMAFCRENGLDNVSFFAKDFKNMDLKEEGMFEKYDMVFSSITPAIGYKGGYEKAMEMSKSWFFNANFISVTDTLQSALVKELQLQPVRSRDGAGFYCMLGELILNGYYPELTYYKESDVDEYTAESAFAQYSEWFYRNGMTGEQEKQMKEALVRLCNKDGKIFAEKEWVYVWLLVNKNRQIVH